MFSHSVESSSLWPHGLQHARLPCPSLSNFFYWILTFFLARYSFRFCQILVMWLAELCFSFPLIILVTGTFVCLICGQGSGPTPFVPPLLILECSSHVTVERKVLVVCHINTPMDYYCKIFITIILLLLSLLQNPGLNWRK